MLTPLIAAALFYILGIASASVLKIPVIASFAALSSLFALALFAFRLGKNRLLNLFLALDVIAAGMCFYAANIQPISRRHIVNYISGWETGITGTVVQEPEYRKGRLNFLVEAEEVESSSSVDTLPFPAKGLVRVTCPAKKGLEGALKYGERVLCRGKLGLPPMPSSPDRFNYRAYLANKKIFAVLAAREVDDLGRGKVNTFLGIAAQCRRYIRKTIENTLSGDEAGLLKGVLLGDRGCISPELNSMFITTGLAHTLVVSGMNVSLVASIFFLLFYKWLRLPRKIVSFIIIPFVLLYCFMTGAEAPVVRATILTIVVLLGYVLEREPDMYNNLALAALVILVFNPLSLFDASFQLSFLATLGLVYLTPFFQGHFEKVMPRWTAGLLAVSVGAQIGVAPLLAYYFNRVSIVALLANIFVVPVMGIILALGLLAAILNSFSFALAKFVSVVNFVFLWYFACAVRFFGSFPWASLDVSKPLPVFMAGYYAAMFAPQFRYGKWVFMGLWAALAAYVWVAVFV